MNEEARKLFQRMVSQQKQAAVSTLFKYLFLLRCKRLPQYWEQRLGEALITGELEAKRPPKEMGLKVIHEVAAEVLDAITTSEAVMISAPAA
jgi:hypothetical protein